jgi:hypothetical protein|tara:strand:+ start:666 stop:1511 length:846 start_codon:yes stop_codon:yes gene_type:complete
MGYIGVQPEAGFTSGLLDRFTSQTGSTVTLTHDISSENDIIVFVNFVKQDSTNYSVGGSGNKTLTLGGTLVSSDIVEVHYLNIVKLTQQPSANSVGVTELNLSDGTSGQALTTNGSGTLSFSTIESGNNKPMFEAYLNADQDVSGGTATKVAFNTEQHDTDNVYDNSSNYRFTVPSGQAGNYYIYASVQLGQEENYLGYGDVRIYKNGSTYKVTNLENILGDSGSYQKFEIMPIDANMVLAVGDYVEIYAVCGAFGGGSNNHFKGHSTNKKSWFGGYKLIT